MSTTSAVMEILELERKRLRTLPEGASLKVDAVIGIFQIICAEISILQQQVASLSTSITSATSASGTETEASPSPTGKPGRRRRKSIRGEPAGKTERNTGESLENESPF